MSAAVEGGVTTAFDRALKKRQRARVALRGDSDRIDALRDEVASRICGRIKDIKSDKRSFPVTLDLGANSANFLRKYSGEGGIKTLYMLESCREMLHRHEHEWAVKQRDMQIVPMYTDEEAPLPLPDESVDMVVSSMSLHWINDLPGVLAEVRRVLRPDGVFLAAMLGGETLVELRSAFTLAQMEREGGVSAHTSAMVGIADAGNLLTSTGFALPTVDTDVLAVEYEDAGTLFDHLRSMGESNASLMRRDGGRPDTMLAAASAYHALYGEQDGVVSATFQLIYMIGWKPATTQPRALRRGSVPKGFAARELAPASK